MTSDWKPVTLGDVAYLSSDKIELAKINMHKYISTDNMLTEKGGIEDAVKLPNAKRVNHFKRGDVLFSNIRPYFKKVWFAEFEGGASADVLIWKPIDEAVIIKEYLYYILSSDDFIEYTVRTSKGVKMPRGDKEAMRLYELLLPPIEVQKRIASIGRNIDLKINNNTKMNQTLEKVAQRIFKAWFVDFDPVKANVEGIPFDGLSPEIQALFPDELEESELGDKPKGWSVSNIGKEFDVTMGQSPPGSSYNESEIGTTFFQGRKDFGFRFPANRVYTTAPKRKAAEEDTLLSVRAPVGDLNMALSNCCIGRGLAALRHISGCPSYTYYTAKTLKAYFDSFDQEGTVFGAINQGDLKDLKILSPDEDVVEAFSKTVQNLDKKIFNNTRQIETLIKLRDNLLPRLLSGRLPLRNHDSLAVAS